MQHAQRLTLEQMREFVASSSSLTFAGADRKEIYGLVERVLAAQHYGRLGKRQKGIVRRVLARLSGLSRNTLRKEIHTQRWSLAPPPLQAHPVLDNSAKPAPSNR